jgi:hypothetical protein
VRAFGTALIVFAVLVALAAIGAVFGEFFERHGIPFSGAIYPWWLWLPAGALALVAGVRLRRRARAERDEAATASRT